MRIICDIDDTCVNFSDGMQKFLAAKGFIVPTRLRDNHNIAKLFGLTIPDTIALVSEFHRSSEFGCLLPEPCAKDVLPELHRRGYRFIAISACLNEPEVVARRTRNLEDAFGFKWEAIHCLGLTLDKTDALRAYPPSIWVEDLWRHAVSGAEAGHRSFVLDRPYNRGKEHPSITRVQDWHEIANLLN